MTGGLLAGNILRGLAFRVLLYLSLALLPFGVISILQSQEVTRQAQRSAELSLLALTEQAASAERAAIQEGFGVISALGRLVALYRDDPGQCAALLSAYIEDTPHYSHIGFLRPDGQLWCSSTGRQMDLSSFPGFVLGAETPMRQALISSKGPLSGQPVVVLTHPFSEAGQFAGFVTLSMPLSAVRGMSRPMLDRQPFDLVTFNADGVLLLSDRGIKYSARDLPQGLRLSDVVTTGASVLRDVTAAGEERVYAIVPIVPGVVYTMSIWRDVDMMVFANAGERINAALPVLMWLASLVVAFWSVNRLAVRHIYKLGRQMRIFAYNRALPRSTLGDRAPREFIEMQKTFVSMADSIIRDEAALEDSLRDKNILLKEVHHRVKNNLQLISSIMNMQIRRAQTEDARFVLKRLQERILSLATVHKNLYQNDALDRVDAGVLLKEIVGQLLVVGLPAGCGVKVTQSYDALEMDADDAAPLTLLVSEAVTNALKYIGAPEAEQARLAVHLKRLDTDQAEFSIANTTGPNSGSEGTGLGSQLINAFARQLNADVSVGYEAGVHTLTMRFRVTYRDRTRRDF